MSTLDQLIARSSTTSPEGRVLAAVALIFVILPMTLGAFVPINGVLYDAATRFFWQTALDDVVVVEVESDTVLEDVGWAELARELLESGSRAVAFTFLPPEPDSAFDFSEAIYLPALSDSGTYPQKLVSEPSRRGEVIIPPSQYGVHRTQLTSLTDLGGSRRTLEAVVTGTSDNRPFYVRFPGGIDGIPRVALEDLVQGRIPDELIVNRVVLIGQVFTGGVGLTTSANPNQPVMDPLLYHAFALQTLMSDSVPRALSLLSAAALVVLAGAIGAATYLRTPPRHTLAVAVVVTLIILTAGLIALLLLNTVIPVVELLLLQISLSFLIWRRREELQNRALQGVTRSISSDTLNVSSADRMDQWPLEILELSESTVLSLDERHRFTPAARGLLKHLKMPESVVSGTDPAFDKVARTLTAVPLETFRPLTVLAPLSREGLLVGYWLLRPKDPGSNKWRSSVRVIEAFSAAITHVAASSRDAARRPLKEQVYTDFSEALKAQRSRVRALEQVLNETAAGVYVCDLLGNEILCTQRFREQLSATGVDSGGGAGPIALVGSLSGLDEDKSAATFRFVVSERSRISLPMTGSNQRHVVLNLCWLAQEDVAGGGFLLFQIVDFSQAARIAEVQRTASEQLGYMVRNDLEAVGLASALLEHPSLDAQDRIAALYRMSQAIDRARQRLLSIEPFLQSQLIIGADDVHMLRVEEVLNDVVLPARQNHTVELEMPDVMAAVIAAPEVLRRLLRSALAFLGDDARADAPVAIFVVEENDRIRIELASAATGLTQERLEAYLTGEREAESHSLRSMIEAAKSVAAWGGSFEGYSDAKTNVRMVLTLKKLV